MSEHRGGTLSSGRHIQRIIVWFCQNRGPGRKVEDKTGKEAVSQAETVACVLKVLGGHRGFLEMGMTGSELRSGKMNQQW